MAGSGGADLATAISEHPTDQQEARILARQCERQQHRARAIVDALEPIDQNGECLLPGNRQDPVA